MCTIDGQRYSIGDVNIPFTIQSTSKPITYAIALNTLGSEAVHNYVGQEPSGRIFNELILDYDSKNIEGAFFFVCTLIACYRKTTQPYGECRCYYYMRNFTNLNKTRDESNGKTQFGYQLFRGNRQIEISNSSFSL